MEPKTDDYRPYAKPDELTKDQFDEYIENFNPFMALAIKHYNKKIRDDKGKEYRFSHLTSTGNGGRQTYYGELGILCHLFWEAVPKTPGAKIIMGDSSTEGAKIFYARVHEMPDDIHVTYCGIYNESVDESESCEICGLHSSEKFRKKAQELEEEFLKKAQEIEDGQGKKSKRSCLMAGVYAPIIPISMCPDYEKFKRMLNSMNPDEECYEESVALAKRPILSSP